MAVKIKLPVTGGEPNEGITPKDDGTPSIDKGDKPTIDIEGKKYDLDDGGNAIDTEGKIVKTKEEIEKPPSDKDDNKDDNKDDTASDDTGDKKPDEKEDDAEIVMIDEKEYKLNEKGDAINDDGSVFMSKEDMDKLERSGEDNEGEEGESDSTSLSIDEIEKLSGIEVYDDKGQKIQYENTLEGIAKREADIKTQFLNAGKSEALREFLESNPDIYRMASYKDKHGTLEGYKERTDYSKIVIDKDNKQQLSDIILEAEMAKGNSLERAKKILKYIEADENLYEEAKDAQNFLTDVQNKEIEREREAERSKIKSQQEKLENFYGFTFDEKGKETPLNIEGSVYDMIINKGKVDDFTIPTDGIKVKTGDGKVKHYSRKDILHYIASVSEGGMSQAQIDEQKRLSNKNKLLKQYIYNLTGGDVSSIVRSEQNRQNVKRVKQRLKTSSKQKGSHTSNAHSTKRVKLPIN